MFTSVIRLKKMEFRFKIQNARLNNSSKYLYILFFFYKKRNNNN